jgi:hypothetical protein
LRYKVGPVDMQRLLSRSVPLPLCAFLSFLAGLDPTSAAEPEVVLPAARTVVSIVGEEFYVNGTPTYEGRTWRGLKLQGLLLNARLVQGIFDDRNPETVQRWAYPDTGKWDPERNVREFLAALPDYRRHGLLAFTLNLQGGSPEGYSQDQPWHNSAFEADGSLRPDYLGRLERVLDKADELGMVVILGIFYFGQDQRLQDEAAVIRGVDHTIAWLFEKGYRHVLIEINNECNVRYDHALLRPDRVHELIERVRNKTQGGRRFYAGTSYGGGTLPQPNVARVSDFLLLHGNGVSDPARIAEMVRQTRAVPSLYPKPILFNEDDHFDFDQPTNNFVAALSERASWGFFDPGTNNYVDGFQSPPVNWRINTDRKRAFFKLVAEMTGTEAAAPPSAAPPTGVVVVRQTNYHGWAGAYHLSNGKVEAVVVPALGRVMQFGFVGEEGVFWENRALDGQPLSWEAPEWMNFGGDKAWPSPEADWSKFTKRPGWHPPPAFDGLPMRGQLDGTDLVLISEVDPFYGVRVYRRVHLAPDQPVMVITTTFERVSGEQANFGIWVVTQLREPVGVYVPLPAKPTMPRGYRLLTKDAPPSLKVERGLLSLTRNPAAPHKIGTEADTLLWVGEKHMLRIDSPRVTNLVYPDGGSSAEVYTSPDPLKYVELETLGPLYIMRPGSRTDRVNTYTLLRREDLNPEYDARRVLGR